MPSVIEKAEELLRQPIAAATWKGQLVELEALQIDLAKERRTKQAELAKLRNDVKPMKDGKVFATDLDRQLYIDSAAAELQGEHDLLCDIQEFIVRRIELARLLNG